MLRNQRKLTALQILPGISLDLNAFTQAPGTARVLRNYIPERGRLKRKAFAPDFTITPNTVSGDVWHLSNFRYRRANAPENKLLIYRSNGRLYRRIAGYEHEIFPAVGTISLEGPKTDATATSVGSGTAWTGLTNAASSNEAYATVTLTTSTQVTSQYLLLDNLSFAIPAGNQIYGIQVNLETNVSYTYGAGVLDFRAYLTKDGSNPATPVKNIPQNAVDTTDSLGDSNDLWSASWSASDANATTFGVLIQAFYRSFSGSTSATFNVDYGDVTVWYATSTPTVLTQKPFQGQLSNRHFFSDGIISRVYDGRDVQVTGLARSTTAPAVSAVAAGSITAATGLKAAISWVVLDEESNRVHESSRSNVSSFQVLAAENLRVDITALSPPARATHYSVYVSELDGSEILKRAATTRITTLTTDISALPSAVSPKAPIRNDPGPHSTVGCIAKNRIFVRDDANPNTFWFSALGEVKGLNNGAPEESFPGYGTNSISDIVNSDFITDREIRSMLEHENVIFIWSERRCFALVGELNLLDNRAPRSILKLVQFQEGAAGADSAVSTPYGLIWMNPGRKIWLWTGGTELIDIGVHIQSSLDNIPNDKLEAVDMTWWSGNGRQWLVVNCYCATNDDDTQAGATNRTFVLDFSIQQQNQVGTWFEWTDVAATATGTYYDEQGTPFLLMGDTSGNVKLQDSVSNPAHLNYTCKLGSTYLGSTVQNNPRAYMRTGLLLPNGDIFTEVQYLQVLAGDQVGAGAPAAGSLTQPTLTSRIDIENPDVYGTGISLTLDTAISSGDRRAWLVPQSSGNTNVGGAMGKQFIFDAAFAAGNDSTGESDGRLTARLNSLYKLAMVYIPRKEDTV